MYKQTLLHLLIHVVRGKHGRTMKHILIQQHWILHFPLCTWTLCNHVCPLCAHSSVYSWKSDVCRADESFKDRGRKALNTNAVWVEPQNESITSLNASWDIRLLDEQLHTINTFKAEGGKKPRCQYQSWSWEADIDKSSKTENLHVWWRQKSERTQKPRRAELESSRL